LLFEAGEIFAKEIFLVPTNLRILLQIAEFIPKHCLRIFDFGQIPPKVGLRFVESDQFLSE
jgi:hypothetical protein